MLFSPSKAPPTLAVLGTPSAVAQLIGARPRGGKLHDILHRGLGNVGEGLLGEKGLMGGDDDVGHGDEPCQHVVVAV